MCIIPPPRSMPTNRVLENIGIISEKPISSSFSRLYELHQMEADRSMISFRIRRISKKQKVAKI